MDTKQTDPKKEILKKHLLTAKFIGKKSDPKEIDEAINSPDMEFIYNAMQEYHEVKSKNSSLVSEWQLCPKCAGKGNIPALPGSTNTTSICDVCNGSKTLVKPILNDELEMKYALLQVELQDKDRELERLLFILRVADVPEAVIKCLSNDEVNEDDIAWAQDIIKKRDNQKTNP